MIQRVLLTGHDGYLGSAFGPMLQAAGHEVVGLDSFLFEGCHFGAGREIPAVRKDTRDVQLADLAGFDAVIHLAALSNDPIGNLDPDRTLEINHVATVRLAQLAKRAGVRRFLFASSCSLYGVAGDSPITETAAFRPVTPYAISKVLAERDLAAMADANFSPVFLRNATAYGLSPKLRLDLVVNNLVAFAMLTGEVLVSSDGSPWRPLVHVEDIGRAFLTVLEAPTELVHNAAFNVGRTEENYQVRDIAAMVAEVVPGSVVKYAPDGGPDPRCYRVDCTKLATTFPNFAPKWTLRRGIEQLYDGFRQYGLAAEDLHGSKYLRIRHLQTLLEEGRLDSDLRWTEAAAAPAKSNRPRHGKVA